MAPSAPKTYSCEQVDLSFVDTAPFRFVSTVDMRGGITGAEEFLAWEPYSHMAFRFNESTSDAISAFAEDYRVVQTPQGCHLTWVMAMKPKGNAARIGMQLGKPVMARVFQRFLHNLDRYAKERFSTAPPTPNA